MLYFIGDGRMLPITNMLDADGDETDDPALATRIVAQLPDGQFLASQCFDGEIIERLGD